MAQEEQDARTDLVRRGVLDQDHPLRAMHLRHATRLGEVLDEAGGRASPEPGPRAPRPRGSWPSTRRRSTCRWPSGVSSCSGGAVEAGDAPARHLAILTDAVRWQEGRPQVYGSVHVVDQRSQTVVPWPIEDPDDVDERRAAVGLPELAAHTRALQTRHRTERGL